MTTTPHAVSQCKTCRHPQVKKIEADLRAGASTYAVAARYGLKRASVERHRRKHMDQRVVSKYERKTEADEVRDQIKGLYAVAVDVLKKAKDAGNGREILLAVKEARATIGLLGKLVGVLNETTVNVGVGVQVNHGVSGHEIRTALFKALDRHPEARADVVRELNALQVTHDRDPGD